MLQVDNVTFTQRKTFALALSIILTLRMSQVLDKLEQILRYFIYFILIYLLLCSGLLDTSFHSRLLRSIPDSVCTSVILGGNDELTEEESRFALKLPLVYT